ncbi:MAG: cobalt-precorrin-6A reductase [Cucumibacter sp.]
MRILILGGTGEAVELANQLAERRHKVTTSLAGRTNNPHRPKGKLQVGGFGGAEGLAKFLADNHFDYLIDATHPFAAQISAHAVAAGKAAKVPLLRLERAPWPEPEKAGWVHVKDEEEAARALPVSATVLLTIGRQHLGPFVKRADCRFILRSIEAPEREPPENFVLHPERPPFTKPAELALMRRFGISHLVAKNSGGEQTAAKLDAAFFLKVKVVMINRPGLPPAQTVATVEETLEVVDHLPTPARRFTFLP